MSAPQPEPRDRVEPTPAFDVTLRVDEVRTRLATSPPAGADIAVVFRDRLVGIVALDRLAHARGDLSLACVMDPPTPERLIADIFEAVDGPARAATPSVRSVPAPSGS